MSAILILTRHAQAAPASGGFDDHERPLTDRGSRDADRLGRWLAGLGLSPALALVSSARRTRQTLDAVATGLPIAAQIVEDRLYDASAGTMLSILRQIGAPHSSSTPLMLVAHNPGIATLAGDLAVQSARRGLRRYTPGTTAILEFGLTAWKDLRGGSGQLIAQASPEDLPD